MGTGCHPRPARNRRWSSLGGHICVALTLVAAPAARASAQTTLTFEQAIARAMDANPTLRAERLRLPVDRAAMGVARERPNPEFRVEFERETPTSGYGVSVPLEVGGQRGRRIDLSEATSRAGAAELIVSTMDVRTAVRRAYFGRIVADARAALFEEQRGLAVRVRDAASARFDAGTAPRLEVLQADLAVAQADNDLTSATAAGKAAQAELNALLGLPLDAAVTLGTPLDPQPVPPLADALARAHAGSASLAALTSHIAEAEARVRLARAERAPDVVAEGTLTRGAEPEFDTGWRAAASVTLPLFTRHQAAVAVEEATLAQLVAARDAAAADLDRDVTATMAQAAADRQSYLRYRNDILGQAAAIEQMADDSYRLGQTGLAAYLLALQSTRDARLRALQAAADSQNAIADLEQAMGTPLP